MNCTPACNRNARGNAAPLPAPRPTQPRPAAVRRSLVLGLLSDRSLGQPHHVLQDCGKRRRRKSMAMGIKRRAMCRALCLLLCAAGSRRGGRRAVFCAAAALVEPMCLRGGGAARTEEGSAARGGRRNVACFDDREARFRLEREQAASVSAQRTPPGPRRGVTWDESNLEANRRDVEVCCLSPRDVLGGMRAPRLEQATCRESAHVSYKAAKIHLAIPPAPRRRVGVGVTAALFRACALVSEGPAPWSCRSRPSRRV